MFFVLIANVWEESGHVKLRNAQVYVGLTVILITPRLITQNINSVDLMNLL